MPFKIACSQFLDTTIFGPPTLSTETKFNTKNKLPFKLEDEKKAFYIRYNEERNNMYPQMANEIEKRGACN